MADQSACPVDHKTRDAWIEQAREAEAKKAQDQAKAAPPSACPVDHTARPQPKSWSQTIASYTPWGSSAPAASPPPAQPPRGGLETDRAVSTIPRTTGAPAACPVDHGDEAPTKPANHEMETGLDPSGNWVYPSEKMFFDAMKRKGYDARVADMKTVVPIHNAVNERAWKEIKEWEAPYLKDTKCDGPKLESFANKLDRMTPTARINTILGFTAPFDRHDWVIDRCGTRVDYVIDFYAGRPDGKGGPSFYLDVRPKLNTWEGVKMRAMRWAWLA
ncbi:cytochrome c/c1 heme-lyase [Dactylonectria estremocensis]|uniref:Holocytochrome c-type synthase n=1 Tax=Dactylonectria estremocensis TaxID=1079267 RepID=A0A9P9F0V4_9HYPO|nr:cytochrome c/c1 heme-lyase [Dactylonectria estremocensis]